MEIIEQAWGVSVWIAKNTYGKCIKVKLDEQEERIAYLDFLGSFIAPFFEWMAFFTPAWFYYNFWVK